MKTDDSAYSVNFRCQSLITVTDASVVEAEVTVPKGDYAGWQLPLGDLELLLMIWLKDLIRLMRHMMFI